MAHAVRLQQEEPNEELFRGLPVFRIRFTVTDFTGFTDDKIFVWRKTPYDPWANTEHDEFESVASVFDLTAYPANAPIAGQNPRRFRRNVAVITAPSVDQAREAASMLKDFVNQLCETADNIEVMNVVSQTWIPAEPET
jgi:hypothetical protein